MPGHLRLKVQGSEYRDLSQLGGRGDGYVRRCETMRDVGVRKCLDILASLPMTRSYPELELVISRWMWRRTLLSLPGESSPPH